MSQYKKTPKKDLIKLVLALESKLKVKSDIVTQMNKSFDNLRLDYDTVKVELEKEKNKPVVVASSDALDDEHLIFLQERVKNSIHPHLVKLYQKELNRVLKL